MDQPQYSKVIKGKGRFMSAQLTKLGEVLNWPVEDFSGTGPLVVRVENSHGNNGYVNIENQQQSLPVDLVERMLHKNEERWDMMMKHWMDFMERMLKKS